MFKKIGLLLVIPLFSASGVMAHSGDENDNIAGWHKSYTKDLQGANITAALELLKSKGLQASVPVVVGIIDSGVDTATVSLQKALWTNAGEQADGRDSDGNGYIDDVHGWNFLGTADGTFNMTSAGTEEYRQFKRLYPKYKHVKDSTEVSDKQEYAYYLKMRKRANIDNYLKFYEYAKQTNRSDLELIRQRVNSIEHDADKRLLMGDNLEDANDRYYGNSTLTIDGCEHGTFVAGIIAGNAEQDHRYDGIALGIAKVMIVRASPEGDEYDKDVATSIRYAVDNGARVINISLGKYESPQARMVNDAIRYAGEHDVLVVCAAGNNARNLDTIPLYPQGTDRAGRFLDNFIRVGASHGHGGCASMSNYGGRQVHLFAPGTMIASVFPGNKYDMQQGTSLAAPVVTGIAALIRSYFPYLKASQVRQLLMETVRPMTGEADKSISGGVVDMLAAVKRLTETPVDWYRAESVSDKSVGSAVYHLQVSPSFVDATPYVRYEHNGRQYMVDARTGKVQAYDQSLVDAYKQRHPTAKDRRTFSYDSYSAHTADSAFTMLGDRYNLHIRNNKTGEVRPLTTDGREFASYCSRGATDELSDRHASGFWRHHVYFDMIYDDTEVEYLNVVHSLDQPMRLEQKKMPLPGGSNIRRYRMYWYNADTGEGRLLKLAPNDDYNIQLDYDKQGTGQYFLRRSRSVDTLELCRITPETGEVKVVISEVCRPHVNINMFHYHLLDHGREVLWWSDRSGRGNYYLYDGITGKLKNRITQGDRMVADRIECIDTLKRTLIFMGHGEEGGDPHYTYYYKVNFNGRQQQLLTPGNGTHEMQLSKNKAWAIDRYSRMDMPPVWQVVDISKPRRHHEFFRTSETACQKAGWVKPTLIKVKAADGQTDLYGVMYLPSTIDTTRKYPIISNVYPGPQDDQIPRRFTVDENGNQSLAELGFVVINVQPRGSSPLRDRDFYCYGYGNLRDYPVADDKHTIETLAARYPFIDLDRVGIYGHSGGGFETVTAMLTYPDFYKVGVAASGNHDNRAYIQWWAETYHGYGREIPTNMELAGKLKGRLLLMTGEVDDNVPIASTIRMADALQKAGKRFDFMLFPGQGHGLYGDYYQNTIRYYFLDHLVKPGTFDININQHQSNTH